MTQHADSELVAGVNLAAAVLKTGPIAGQVKRVWEAVRAKNNYYHDRIFRGVVLMPVQIPDFLDLHLTPEEIESKRKAAVAVANIEAGAANRLGVTGWTARGAPFAADTRTRPRVAVIGESTSAWLCGPLHAD